MMIYSVTIVISPDVEAEWLDWMTQVHIPDVLRTGCFLECHIYKISGAQSEEPTYALQYHCHSVEHYERYQKDFAPALQKEHSGKFAGRFRASRQVLEEITVARLNRD